MQADADPGNNWQPLAVKVTGKNGVDLEAIGATARGGVGTVVDVNVGVRNNGPATLDRTANGGAAAVVIITIPGGTTVVAAPYGCRIADDDSLRTGNGGLQYACFTDPELTSGGRLTWKFRLKITNFWPDASGFVEVNPPCNCDRFADDTDKSNNVAPILMNPSGGGEGGGLPITGPQTTTIGAAGAALVAAGLLGFLLARRRRTRFEA